MNRPPIFSQLLSEGRTERGTITKLCRVRDKVLYEGAGKLAYRKSFARHSDLPGEITTFVYDEARTQLLES